MEINIDLSKYNYNDSVYDICQKYNQDKPNIVLDNYRFDIWMMQNNNAVPFIIQNGKIAKE